MTVLRQINAGLVRLAYQGGLLDPTEVDIRFDAPTNEQVDSLIRPTMSLFLFDVKENIEKRETNMQTIRGNGSAERRMRPRRIDLHYMVSVLTTDVQDEHELLWRVLATLLKYQELPQEMLPEPLKAVEPRITTRMADDTDGSRLIGIWNALDVPPHPALHYIVTAPLDLEIAIQAPLVLTRTARYKSSIHGGAVIDTTVQIGGIVRDGKGRPLANVIVKLENSAGEGSKSDQDGRFVVPGLPNGVVTLDVIRAGKIEKRLKAHVPQESYDIVLDE
jgi:hypothetical protein